MTDHDQGGAGSFGLLEQEVEEGLLMVAVERRGGLVGDHDRGIADERPRYRDPLLLADAEG